MREAVFLVLAAGLAAAPPALAQSPGLQQTMDLQLRASELQAQQAMTERQLVIQQNQLMALEAQLRAQQAYADVRAQSYVPRLPPPPEHGAAPQIDTSQLASMPDATLAESNARVKAAANNRR